MPAGPAPSYFTLFLFLVFIIGAIVLAAYIIAEKRYETLPKNEFRKGDTIQIRSTLVNSKPLTIDTTNCSLSNDNSDYIGNACMMTFTGDGRDTFKVDVTRSLGVNGTAPNIAGSLNQGHGNRMYLINNSSETGEAIQLNPYNPDNVEFIVGKDPNKLRDSDPGFFAPFISPVPVVASASNTNANSVVSSPIYKLVYPIRGVNPERSNGDCPNGKDCVNSAKIRLRPGLLDINTSRPDQNNQTTYDKPAMGTYGIGQPEDGADLDYLFFVRKI
ncbi:MAG: hypothetical protein GY751_00275 [Bacteroidetes bacterium]|nr:hypothetical protein [Bacteroidota bacterium]